VNERAAKYERGTGWVYIAMPFVPFVLLNLITKNTFVRRHSQQGLALGLIFWTCLFAGGYMGSICLSWLAAVLFVWIGGIVWGRRQVKRGDCWLMRQFGEESALPRPWALSEEEPQEEPIPVQRDDIRLALSRGQRLVTLGRYEEAVNQFMVAYRRGSPNVRRVAINRLAVLGEVEEF